MVDVITVEEFQKLRESVEKRLENLETGMKELAKEFEKNLETGMKQLAKEFDKNLETRLGKLAEDFEEFRESGLFQRLSRVFAKALGEKQEGSVKKPKANS